MLSTILALNNYTNKSSIEFGLYRNVKPQNDNHQIFDIIQKYWNKKAIFIYFWGDLFSTNNQTLNA